MLSKSRRVAPALLAVTLAFAPTGCGTSRIVIFNHPQGSGQVQELNERAAKHDATVILAGGETLQAASLRIDGDSTSWLDPDTREARTTETSAIEKVEFRSSGRGALNGLGIGILTGGGALALLGLAEGDDTCPPGRWCFFQWTAEEKAGLYGVTGGVLGGLAGLLIGAAVGRTDSYVMTQLDLEAPATAAKPAITASPEMDAERRQYLLEHRGRLTMQEWEELQKGGSEIDSTRARK